MSKKKAAAASTAKAKSSSAKAVTDNPTPPEPSGPRLPFRRPQSWNFAGVGRNDICPCGSGKRFKNCHGH